VAIPSFPRRAASGAVAITLVTAAAVLPVASPALAATWTVVPSADQTDFDNVFRGADLTSATGGWAVGYADTGTSPTRQPIIERYDGTRFTAVPGATVAGGGELRDVDATTTIDAWAVGFSSTGSGSAGLVEHWNGASWRIVPVTDPAPKYQNYLLGVQAFADGTAWAVGSSSVPGSLDFVTVAQRWTGGSWVQVPTPSPSKGTNQLTGVSGSSPADVWAVGFIQAGDDAVDQPLIEHWNGTAWTAAEVPASRAASLDAVVAIDKADAWAVGTHFSLTGLRYEPYALHWDGSAWKETAFPSMAGRLDGVAALSTKQVYAVGGGGVFRWNGSAWAGEPSTGSAVAGTLWDAAAAGPSSVLAAGSRTGNAICTVCTFAVRTNNG
jgi:hypothetical protein